MTREEIMKMDGQALCDWMGSKGVEFYEECVFSYDGEKSVWNLPACAFAARDYVVKMGRNGLYEEYWLNELYGTMKILRSAFAQPLDWLRAAAIVVMENEK